jgi:hypothetical protein
MTGPFRCEKCGGTPGEHRRYRGGKVPPDAVLAVYAPHNGWPRHSVAGEYCHPTFAAGRLGQQGERHAL